MPDRYLLSLSAVVLVCGVMLFLFPAGLIRFSRWVNRLLAAPDQLLMRYRYLVGLLCFVASYCLFRLALLVAEHPLTLLLQ